MSGWNRTLHSESTLLNIIHKATLGGMMTCKGEYITGCSTSHPSTCPTGCSCYNIGMEGGRQNICADNPTPTPSFFCNAYRKTGKDNCGTPNCPTDAMCNLLMTEASCNATGWDITVPNHPEQIIAWKKFRDACDYGTCAGPDTASDCIKGCDGHQACVWSGPPATP